MGNAHQVHTAHKGGGVVVTAEVGADDIGAHGRLAVEVNGRKSGRIEIDTVTDMGDDVLVHLAAEAIAIVAARRAAISEGGSLDAYVLATGLRVEHEARKAATAILGGEQ